MFVKIARIVLIIYCLVIGGVSILDTVADPGRQPIKNIVTAMAMTLTIAGIFSKKKELLLAIPVYSVFYLAFAASTAHNVATAVGQCLGMVVPLSLVFSAYRGMTKPKTQTPEDINTKKAA